MLDMVRFPLIPVVDTTPPIQECKRIGIYLARKKPTKFFEARILSGEQWTQQARIFIFNC